MSQNNRNSHILLIILLALIIKLALFTFAAIHAPQGKFLPDSTRYLELSTMLATKGVFAIQAQNGVLIYETFRTPDYPLFLAVLHDLMKIPLDGIVLMQVVMTLFAAFIVYKTALEINFNIAFLSAAIMLFDPPVTIFSLTILTETLFLLLISLFMYFFTLYLKAGKSSYIVLSALTLAAQPLMSGL